MLYFRCPTCGTLLADKQIPWESGLMKICSNNKLSKKEKNKQKEELLTNLSVIEPCCRMRMISYKEENDVLI